MNDLARIGAPPEAPARFTVDEFMELVNSSALGAGKFELVEGVIVRMSPALAPHMHYQRAVFRALDAIFGEGLDGRIAQFELSLQLAPATVRDADVAVLSAYDRRGGFPDPASVLLIVEIAHATLDKDLGSKLTDYARAGIPHYWVVDVEGRRVHAMTTPLDGDYAERRLFGFGDALPVPGSDRTIVLD